MKQTIYLLLLCTTFSIYSQSDYLISSYKEEGFKALTPII